MRGDHKSPHAAPLLHSLYGWIKRATRPLSPHRKAERRLLFSSASHSASVSSSGGPYFVSPPARLTRMVIFPQAASVSWMRVLAASSVVRSAYERGDEPELF